jgi:hypothetical protein
VFTHLHAYALLPLLLLLLLMYTNKQILYATTDNCVAVAEDGHVLEGDEAKAYKEATEASPEA